MFECEIDCCDTGLLDYCYGHVVLIGQVKKVFLVEAVLSVPGSYA